MQQIDDGQIQAMPRWLLAIADAFKDFGITFHARLNGPTSKGPARAAPAQQSLFGGILNVHEAAAYLHVSEGFLNTRRSEGGGPKYSQLGRKGKVTYDVADLDRWREDNKKLAVNVPVPVSSSSSRRRKQKRWQRRRERLDAEAIAAKINEQNKHE
jgi:hypothetical protein